MINGAHVILYTPEADADRAFLRDVLQFKSVDAGRGWLIFALPPAEVAVHPSEHGASHEFYLMCDDVTAEVARLAAQGVVCEPITEQGWGRLTHVHLPSGAHLGLYQPQHPTAI